MSAWAGGGSVAFIVKPVDLTTAARTIAAPLIVRLDPMWASARLRSFDLSLFSKRKTDVSPLAGFGRNAEGRGIVELN